MKCFNKFGFILTISLCLISLNMRGFSETSKELYNTNFKALKGSDLILLITEEMSELDMEANPKVNPLREFPYCSTNLKMIPIFGSWKTVRIICDDEEGWDTNIRTNLVQTEQKEIASKEKVSEHVTTVDRSKTKVVKLIRDLKSGETVTEFDVELVHTKKYISSSYFTDMSKVIGRKLKSSIKSGKILKDRNFFPDWAVVKEQPIVIEAKNTSFSVYADGIALANGYLGDLIKVRNLGSGVELYAWVASKKKVYPATNISKD